STLYWIESQSGPGFTAPVALEAMPLKGGPVSVLSQFTSIGPFGISFSAVALTSTTAFLSGETASQVYAIPLAVGVPDAGIPAQVPGFSQGCRRMLADADAMYCATESEAALYRFTTAGDSTVTATLL